MITSRLGADHCYARRDRVLSMIGNYRHRVRGMDRMAPEADREMGS